MMLLIGGMRAIQTVVLLSLVVPVAAFVYFSSVLKVAKRRRAKWRRLARETDGDLLGGRR